MRSLLFVWMIATLPCPSGMAAPRLQTSGGDDYETERSQTREQGSTDANPITPGLNPDGTFDAGGRRKIQEAIQMPGVPAFLKQGLQNLLDEQSKSVSYTKPAGFANQLEQVPVGSDRPDPRRATGSKDPVAVDLKDPLQGPKASPQGTLDLLRPKPAGAPLASGQAAQSASLPELGDSDASGTWRRSLHKKLVEGRTDEALTDAQDEVNRSPDSADAYYERALVYERRGEEPKRMQDLRIAAELNPAKYRGELQKARSGLKLFDASVGDSGMLMDEVSRPATLRKAQGPDLGWLLILASLVVTVFIMIALYSVLRRRYSSEMGQSYKSLALLARGFGRWRAPTVSDSSSSPPAAPGPAPAAPHPRKKPERLHHGQTVANKYLLARFLGHDGTVEVWKAHDQTLDRPALVKRLYAGPESSEERARRLKEAQAAATLHHPNIVDFYEVLDLPDGVFVVYEYNSARSVREILKAKGALSFIQARDVIIPVCRALEHAHHRGITHGGLSPERIVLTPQGYVQVTDFVLARTTAAGSEPYAAPEAKRGEPIPVSDLYSMGMCFLEMLTGRLPGQSAEETDPELPPPVAELLDRTLDLDHRTRIPFARDFLDILKQLPAPADAKPAPDDKPPPSPDEKPSA